MVFIFGQLIPYILHIFFIILVFLNVVGCVPQSMCGSALVIVGMEDVFFVKNTSPMGPATLYVFVFLKSCFFLNTRSRNRTRNRIYI